MVRALSHGNSVHTFGPGEVFICKTNMVFPSGREVYYVRKPYSFRVFFMVTN